MVSPPHQSTWQRLFCRLNPDALSKALADHWAKAMLPSRRWQPAPKQRGSEAVAIDGKCQRTRLAFPSSGAPVHMLAAFLHDQGLILAQEPIDAHPQANQPPLPTEEAGHTQAPLSQPLDKAEAELSVAPTLIKRLHWQGRVLTGDALFCQRSLCELVVSLGGDYLLLVKDNQPTLHEDIRLLFDPPPKLALPLIDRRETVTISHGHGRHFDRRHLIASTDLAGYSDWPHLAQVFRLERTWQEQGGFQRQVRYGITSLPPELAPPERLLALKRGHWQIENRDHYVKDVTLQEDASTIHTGSGPSVMAILRDLTLSLLRQAGHRTIASRLRFNSLHPEAAVALLSLPP